MTAADAAIERITSRMVADMEEALAHYLTPLKRQKAGRSTNRPALAVVPLPERIRGDAAL